MIKNKVTGMLGLAKKAGKLTFGTESVRSAIIKKQAKLVIIAEDAADRTKRNFTMLCEKENIPIRITKKVEEMSQAIGQVNKAVISINDKNFSEGLIKIIDGGDTIG